MALLQKVKSALRISRSTMYDDEIESYILAVKDDCARNGVVFDDEESPQLILLCIMYAKSQMGISNTGNGDIWLRRYKERLINTVTDVRFVSIEDDS